jgi:F-type H+-transporting ATPase subunit b
MPAFLQPDIQQIVSQAVGFLLLLWVLRRFAWGPLLGALESRRARIEEELRRIEQGKAELTKLQADYGARLAKIEEEARTKIQEAIIEGKRIASEIQEQARAQGYAIVNKSKETVELELAKANVTLRDHVAAMTMEATEQILRRKLDEHTDRQLVEMVLNDLEQGSSRS